MALARSYNRWLVDIWKAAPDRLRWIAMLPLLSMDEALEEARFATLLARTDGWIGANPALESATISGARCFELEDQIGQLKEGFQADLTVVSLTGAHQIPNYDPVATLIFASSGRDVILTVIAGREVFREGNVAGVDEERLRSRMNKICEKLL